MRRGVPSAVEAAERARELMSGSGAASRPVVDREAARRTGTLVTPGQLAELAGERTVEVAVISYEFATGGRIPPPVDVVVRCRPDALEGVRRSMSKLIESRGWSAEARVSRDRLPESRLARGGEVS